MSLIARSNDTNPDHTLKSFRFGIHSLVPPFLLESFALGVISISLLLVLYALITSRRWGRGVALQALGIVSAYGVLVTHWVLEQRSIHELLLESALAQGGYSHGRAGDSMPPEMKIETFVLCSFFPLVTETVLFAISTSLFVLACYALRRNESLRLYSGQTVLAGCMYIVALLHWIISITTFCSVYGLLDHVVDDIFISQAPFVLIDGFHHIAPIVLLSMNIVMSDAIVLWRVVILWGKWGRPDIFIAAVSMCCFTAGLTIWNLASILKIDPSTLQNMFTPNYFSESMTTGIQRADFFGILALCSSLGSNVIATCLVGNKAWIYRTQIIDRFRRGTTRTMAERVIGILVESGAIYCIVWVLYIAANLASVPTDGVPGLHLVDHLNVALAQLTSIYPTLIIILVALDQSYCDCDAHVHDLPLHEPARPVSVTIAIDVTRSTDSSVIRPIPLSQARGDSQVNLQGQEKPDVGLVPRRVIGHGET